MNPQVQAVKQAVEILRAAFPNADGLNLQWFDWDGTSLSVHGIKTYEEATVFFRDLNIQRREKTPYQNYTQIEGRTDDILFRCYPDELPPTCRKVKRIERVPKTQTVETGEFIEIEREVVECGPEPEAV